MAEKKEFKVGEAPWERGETPKSFPVGQAPWDVPTKPAYKLDMEKEGALAPEIQGLASALTFGYDPEITAGAMQAAESARGFLSSPFGGEPAQDIYDERRQMLEARKEALQEEYPLRTMSGMLPGFLVPGAQGSIVMRGGQALKGLIGGTKAAQAVQKATQAAPTTMRALQGAATGGAIAGAYKPEEGESRVRNAVTGAAFGATIPVVARGLERGAEVFSDLSDTMALKTAGGMWSNVKGLFERGTVDDVSKWMKEKNLVNPGASVKSVKQKSSQIMKETGEKLRNLYQKAKEKITSPSFVKKLTPEQQDRYLTEGFFPASQKREILSRVEKEMGDAVGTSAGLRAVENYLDDLIAKYGDDMDIITARNIKSELDQAINYTKADPDMIPKHRAFRAMRKYINEKIKSQLNYIDEVVGGKLGKELKQLNRDYGNAKTVNDIAENKFGREQFNRLWGLSEQIAAPAVGLGYGVLQERDPLTSLGYAGLGFLGSRFGKKYGPGLLARPSGGASKVLTGAETVLRGAAPGLIGTQEAMD